MIKLYLVFFASNSTVNTLSQYLVIIVFLNPKADEGELGTSHINANLVVDDITVVCKGLYCSLAGSGQGG